MNWIRGPRIWVGVLDRQGPCWSLRDPHICVCVLVNPRSRACMCGFTSELLPLPAAEEEGTWLLTFR